MDHRRQTTTGLSLIEVLIACLLSALLIRALSNLIVTIAQHTTYQHQHTLLLQHSWLVEQVTLTAIENAGFSAAYPANAHAWQVLSNHNALRLYQYGSEPAPTILQAHFAQKLLKPSTILESVSMMQAQYVHQRDPNSITVDSQPLAHATNQWLLTSADAWQLVRIDKVEHHTHEQLLYFSTPLNAELQQPLLAGLYRHQLWFVALDGQHNQRGIAQYGLYQWNLNTDTAAQEIVSGLTAWHGQIIDTKNNADPLQNDVNTLVEWHYSLSEGSQSLSQVLYGIDANLS